MRASLETWALAGLGIAAALLGAVAIGSYRTAAHSTDAAARVDHTHTVLDAIEDVLASVLDLEASARGYVITGDHRFVEKWAAWEREIDSEVARLLALTADSQDQGQRIQALRPLIADKVRFNTRVVEIRRTEGAERAQALVRTLQGKALMDQIRVAVSGIEGEERRLLSQRLDASRSAARSSMMWLSSLTASILPLLLLVYLLLRRAIATHRRAELVMRRAKEEVQDLYDNAPCGYHSLDADGVFAHINKTALDWLGYAREEMVGRLKFSDILPEKSRWVFQENFRRFKQEGSVRDLEFDLVRKDGGILPVVLNATAVKDDQGRYLKSRSIIFDITERRQAEEERDRFFTLSLDLMCIAGFDGRFKRLNPSWERALGFTTEELTAEPFMSFVHPDDRDATTAAMGELLGGGCIVSFENRYRCKDGSYRWILWNCAPYPEGKLIYATARDITERKWAEEMLRNSNAKLHAIVETAADAIITIDEQRVILSFNASAERMFGYARDEVIGANVNMLMPEPYHSEHDGYVANYLRTGHAKIIGIGREVTAQRKDGKIFPVDLAISDARLSNQRMFVGIARDLTDRVRAEETIKKTSEQLRAANKELDAFSYSVSHDLRAPLRSIDGFSQALLEDCGPMIDERGKGHVQRVRAATQRMGRLIDDLLNLSRLSRAIVQREKVSLSDLANSAADDLRRSDPGRDVAFAIADGLVAEGDGALLRVALDNLLGNAWKYTRNHPSARIQFGSLVQNGGAVYYVRDDGAGFDMAHADKLFSAFQRLHSSKEFEGTGIGLATVARIIHRHGGRIWAEGAVERGATFYFTLQIPH